MRARKLTPAAQADAVMAALTTSWQSASTIAHAMNYGDVQSVQYRLKRLAAAGAIEADRMPISRHGPTNVYRLNQQ